MSGAALIETEPAATQGTGCFHCGEPCAGALIERGEKAFCCQGCLVVHDLLTENGLGQFYQLSRHPGIQMRGDNTGDRWRYLDEPALQQRLVDFTDGKLSRITFRIPAIHCVACVWLLENLFRLHPGIPWSRVNFLRREVSIGFAPDRIKLSELAALLASLGYEPALTLEELEKPAGDPARHRQWLQLGIAGFAFGNVMLFSVPLYLGLDTFSGPVFRTIFGYLSLALALPVLVFSAADYWKSAWLALRRRTLTLDVPIAAGLAALYAQSAFEILSGHGEGYLDSMSGLVFFLLCGRAFQQKTHERLAFDRDYKSFFPLSARRKTAAGEESAALSELKVGDRILIRNGELIPADATLLSGSALIDYSFVTGESESIARNVGDYLYAGGKQSGPAVEVEIAKPVSQSYLTSLWNHEAFRKHRHEDLNTLTNRYSRRFTFLVMAIAAGALCFWGASGDWTRGLKAFTSVLIVACPCALALAAPFTLGTAHRLLGRAKVFLKNALVLERLAEVDAIVFDKTGTLTEAGSQRVEFDGAPLSESERQLIHALARQSVHPHSMRIAEWLHAGGSPPTVEAFRETPGCGVEGRVNGREVRMGSARWLGGPGTDSGASAVAVEIDGWYRGAFTLAADLRKDMDGLIERLAGDYELALLSGDNQRDQARFRQLFGRRPDLRFNQSPLDKLGYIQQLQQSRQSVMMVGDGLNDAGALRQSDVGVAVVERIGAFSPGSDVILPAEGVSRLPEILRLARRSVAIVRAGFVISGAYNVMGVSIAAAGILSPLICAVLMPVSSISVVLFACGATTWAARRAGITGRGQARRRAPALVRSLQTAEARS